MFHQVEDTEQRQLDMAAITTDICPTFLAAGAVEVGYGFLR